MASNIGVDVPESLDIFSVASIKGVGVPESRNLGVGVPESGYIFRVASNIGVDIPLTSNNGVERYLNNGISFL